MNTNSNGYTIAYASILVTIVAALLAIVYSALNDRIEDNVKLDTKKQILSALNIKDDENAADIFEKNVKHYVMAEDGSLKEYDGKFITVFSKDTNVHVFECNVNDTIKYVLPVNGAGLWGPIWGYVALKNDKNTVDGIYLGHEGETPGLGAEIANEKFTEKFIGKKVFGEGSDDILLGVEKNGKVSLPNHQVDGISGGTITSKGVDAMLKDGLSKFKAFLTKSNVSAESASSAVNVTPAITSAPAAADSSVSAEGKGQDGYGDFSEVEKRVDMVDSIHSEVKKLAK